MSNPFLAASGGATSVSSLVLSVSASTANGDNLLIGVMLNVTPPAVPRVTDTQGNTWTQILTDATENAAQLWVFESKGAAALVAGTDTITVTVTQT